MVKVVHGQGWVGGVLRGSVLSSKARLGAIDVLRGLALYGTVLSCPVRLCKALLCEVLLWYGGAWWEGVEQSEVRYGKLSLWPGEVRLGAVGFIGALYSKVRSYCGVVWSVEALHSMVKFCPVKFCPVKYSVALHAKALFWLSGVLHGIAWRGSVGRCLVSHAKALLRSCIVRYGTVRFGFARLRAAGQALVLFWWGDVGRSAVGRGYAW